MKLFISHVREEAPLADAIRLELLECFGHQVDVFLAQQIRLGTNWLRGLQEALLESSMILTLFSRASVSRPWINIETGYGVMSGKRVLPLCHSGLTKTELPVIYSTLQGIDLDKPDEVERLLEDIAAQTPAGRLIGDRAELGARFLSRVSRSRMTIPAFLSEPEAPPCVWFIGSNGALDDRQAQLNLSFLGLVAQVMVQTNVHAVFGRSSLLDAFADSLVAEKSRTLASDPEALMSFANASALHRGASGPNPVVVLGSLRTTRGPRALFLESIGRVPDIAVVVGGTTNGGTPQEVELAMAAAIPVLPLRFTGGYAATSPATLDPAFAAEVDRIQNARRDYPPLARDLCDLIRKHTSVSRSQNRPTR